MRWLHEVYKRSIVTSAIYGHAYHFISVLDRYFPNTSRGLLSKELLSHEAVASETLSVDPLFRIFDARHDRSATGLWAQEAKIRNMGTLDLAGVSILLYSTSIYYTCTTNFEGVIDDFEEAEVQCVFRELSIRFGPYFIWMAIFGSVTDNIWVKKRLGEGLQELREYEVRAIAGVDEIITKRSMQSIVVRELSERSQSDIMTIWIMILLAASQRLIEIRR
jgi:hypothetical protein